MNRKDDAELGREQIYDMVWQVPIYQLAPRLGLSDVGMAKICRQLQIPLPPRGYWMRLRAGLAPPRTPLPRFDGEGPSPWLLRRLGRVEDELEEEVAHSHSPPAVGPAPSFPDDLKQRLLRWNEQVGEVVPLALTNRVHPALEPLTQMAKKGIRDQQYRSRDLLAWGKEPSQDERALQLLNGVFLALDGAGAKPRVVDANTCHLEATVDGSLVYFDLGRQAPLRGLSQEEAGRMLSLRLKDRTGSGPSRVIWNERKVPLEQQLADVVVNILAAGEENRREAIRAEYQQRQNKLLAEQWESQREMDALEQARADKLEKDAEAFRRATEIRALVAAVEAQHGGSSSVDEWCRWALRHADSLDPVHDGEVLAPPEPSWRYSRGRREW